MQSHRRNLTILVCLVMCLIAFGLATRDDSKATADAPPSTTSSTTTTTSTSTTSTTLPVTIDVHENIVATATVPMVAIHEAPPFGVDPISSLAAREGAARRATWPAFSPDRPGSPDLPSLTEAIQGRRRTSTGWQFDNPSPLGNPLVFSVTENHGEWLKVRFPVRPTLAEGWILASDVTLSSNFFHVIINLTARTLTAYQNGTPFLETKVVIGTEDRRTPQGRFYVTDFEEKYPGSAYGSWIMPLNVYSQDLDEFGGGVPVIAVHGTNAPEHVGQARSNGCVRMPDEFAIALRNAIPLGTSVDIVA